MSIKKEREIYRENWVLEFRKSSGDNDVGVVIFVERSSRGIPGSIKNPTCLIWIQWMTTRSRIRGRETVKSRRSKK